ncbi:MAG: nucleoside hydrolase [Sedimentisphaerales bacterium]|nr:nucleoside hydrolase [Sedimentisphaerales bacterium]
MRTRSAVVTIVLLLSSIAASIGLADEKVPILYSTDLHHPHMDPDDHFDLATLFSLPEFDVRGIVLDCGKHQVEAPGEIPVGQMLHLVGREVPRAIGLAEPLRSPDDGGVDQPEEFQGGVRLILDALERSREPVTVFTTGSLRDVVAAFNRRPELLRRKIARLYVNIGDPATGKGYRRNEYNVGLDRGAYVRIMQSDLPVYWCPCFDGGAMKRGLHGTYWKFEQGQVLQAAPAPLQNWFLYALTKPAGADPIGFLSKPQDPTVRAEVWKTPRNMWCTAPLLHAAGRRVYERSEADYIALPPAEARLAGLSGKEVKLFDFVPMKVAVGTGEKNVVRVDLTTDVQKSNAYVFQSTPADYDKVLTSCLKHLFADLEK